MPVRKTDKNSALKNAPKTGNPPQQPKQHENAVIRELGGISIDRAPVTESCQYLGDSAEAKVF